MNRQIILSSSKGLLWRISQKGCEADIVVCCMLLELLREDGKVRQTEDVLGMMLLKGLNMLRKRRVLRSRSLKG